MAFTEVSASGNPKAKPRYGAFSGLSVRDAPKVLARTSILAQELVSQVLRLRERRRTERRAEQERGEACGAEGAREAAARRVAPDGQRGYRVGVAPRHLTVPCRFEGRDARFLSQGAPPIRREGDASGVPWPAVAGVSAGAVGTRGG